MYRFLQDCNSSFIKYELRWINHVESDKKSKGDIYLTYTESNRRQENHVLRKISDQVRRHFIRKGENRIVGTVRDNRPIEYPSRFIETTKSLK